MSALKVTQKIAKLASTGKAGPIALKSGYLRFVVKADAYIEVGSDPTVSTTNSLFVPSGGEVLLKETVMSTPTVGVTNASQAIKFSVPDGMDSPFNVGDFVAVTGCAPAGINTTSAEVLEVSGPDGRNGIHGQRITLKYGDANLAATDAEGEIRRVVYADVNCSGNVHISEVQIVGG